LLLGRCSLPDLASRLYVPIGDLDTFGWGGKFPAAKFISSET
jgi:hypothetical protein